MNKLINKLFSKEYLLFTNMAIGMSFHTTGDFISQSLEIWDKPNGKYDLRRLCESFLSGLKTN